MLQEKIEALRNNINSKFVGKEEITDNMIVALLAGGHVHIEDVLGVGKTTLAKAPEYELNEVFGEYYRIRYRGDEPDTEFVVRLHKLAKNA